MTRRLSLVVVLSLAGAVLVGGAGAVRAEDIDGDYYEWYKKLREAHRQEVLQNAERHRIRAMGVTNEAIARMDQEAEAEKPTGTATVTVDGKDIDFNEPATPAEAIGRKGRKISIWERSPDDYDILKHAIWQLKKEDFRHQRPVEINVRFVNLPDKTYFVVPFVVTNSTNKPRRIAPRLWIITSDMRYAAEVGGLQAHRIVEKSTLQSFETTAELAGYIRENGGDLEQVGFFGPGESRQGLAIFERFDQEMDEMKIVVDGLDNDLKYDKCLRRALVLNFKRRGDEFYPQRESLKFVGKDFEWIWNWYQEIKIEKPSSHTLETATGKRQKKFWYYNYTLKNKSGKAQQLELTRIDTVVKVNIDLTIERKVERFDTGVGKLLTRNYSKGFSGKVEVNLVDDGFSTIHKAKVMREIGAEFRDDRFFKGSLAAGRGAEGMVIFDDTEVDFDAVYRQVESLINSQGFQTTLEDPQKLSDFFVKAQPPVIDLTDAEKEDIRKQVLDAIGPALEADASKKLVVTDVTGKAGIGSGTFRIHRFYVKRGIIEDNWLHKWED